MMTNDFMKGAAERRSPATSKRALARRGAMSFICGACLFACSSEDAGTSEPSDVGAPPAAPSPSRDTAEFVVPATAADVADAERSAADGAELRIDRLELDDGAIEFIDEERAIAGRGVGVVATGSGVPLTRRLIDVAHASALELFRAAAPGRTIPERLLQDHAVLADAGLVPRAPRTVDRISPREGAVRVHASDVDILNGECPTGFSFAFWQIGWHVWSADYGDSPQEDVVDNSVYLVSNTGFSHALGACNHATAACGAQGITGTIYGWTGAAWLYLSGPHKASANGQAVYYGRSGIAIARSRMLVSSVTANCETVYVGANW